MINMRTAAAAAIAGLAICAGTAADAEDSSPLLLLKDPSVYNYNVPAEPAAGLKSFTFMGGGQTLLVIDFEKRTVTAPPGVDINDAARQILGAMQAYLPAPCAAPAAAQP